MAEFVIITGLSGAGRSEAGKHLEDMGWFVIDNLPPTLIPKVAELTAGPGAAVDRVALDPAPYLVGHAPLVPQVADLQVGRHWRQEQLRQGVCISVIHL